MLQHIDCTEYAAFQNACLDDTTRIVSVDIFDTLLLRTTKPEFARFLDIGIRQLAALRRSGLAVNLGAKDLLVVRLLAAQAAYRNTEHVGGVREARYAEIAGILLKACGLPMSADLIKLLAQEELSFEAEHLTPNLLLVDILGKARRKGRRVIGISDMYLSAEQIALLLHLKHLDGLLDTVYSSADFGYGKSATVLYTKVLELEEAEPAAMVHCGDNRVSDYEHAQKACVRAFHVPRRYTWRMVERIRRSVFRWRHGLESL